MADIRNYIKDHLLAPSRLYPTVIQETIVELITERLEELYEYTLEFPEIVSPNMNRLDILKVIADQFLFSVRDDGKLQEQIDILSNILEVYNKRGSIDTIEHMWKYYGGDLPKEVEVVIPSYNLFRYNVSKYSGEHYFEDSTTHRTGVYEVKLTNNTYPIADLKEFMLKELVAAGNYFYFSEDISVDMRRGYTNYPFNYNVNRESLLEYQIPVEPLSRGLRYDDITLFALSGNEVAQRVDESDEEYLKRLKKIKRYAMWSGDTDTLLSLDLYSESLSNYGEYSVSRGGILEYERILDYTILASVNISNTTNMYYVYCTPSRKSIYINQDLYNDNGDRIEVGYFILGSTHLGEFPIRKID